MLTRLMVVVSLHIQVSNHVVYLKLIYNVIYQLYFNNKKKIGQDNACIALHMYEELKEC